MSELILLVVGAVLLAAAAFSARMVRPTSGWVARLMVAMAIACLALHELFAVWIVFHDGEHPVFEVVAPVFLLAGCGALVVAMGWVWFGTRPEVGNLRQAGVSVQDHEPLMQRTVDALPALIAYVDAKQRYRFMNRAYEEWLGRPLAELEGNEVREAFGEDIYRELQPYVEAALSGREVSFEREIPFSDGRRRSVAVHYAPDRDEEGNVRGYSVLTTDVTDRRRAEAALAESQRRLATLINSLPGIAYRCKNDAEWTMEYVSDGCLSLTGYRSEELIGNAIVSYNAIIYPADRAKVRQAVDDGVAQRRPHEMDYRIRTKSGEIRWVWERGSAVFEEGDEPVALEGFVTDITSQRRAEQVRLRLSTAIEQASELVIIVDSRNRIEYANPTFERVTGRSRADLTGKSSSALAQAMVSREQYRQIVRAALAGDGWRGRLRCSKPEGDTYELDAAVSPVRDQSGAVVSYVIVARDITQQAALQRQLEHMQKMEAMGRLAAGVAHDFNNLLTGILSNVGYLQMEIHTRSPLRPYLNDIAEIVARASDLTKRLLTFSRGGVVERRPMDMGQVLEDMERLLRRIIGGDVHLVTRSAEHLLWPVMADIGQIEQVILNLSVNARDAMAGNGTLTFETQNLYCDETHASDIPGLEPGRYVSLVVTDTGCGMDEVTRQHMFEPFYTTKEEGTGLGLAMVYGIVKQHGGHIACTSEPGHGTTFTLCFPALEALGIAPTKQVEPRKPMPPRGLHTVLIVEDEQSILNIATRILRQKGYEVLAASSAEEGLALCREHAGTVDLLFTGVVLPRMSGQELAEQIAPLMPGLRVLYTSGHGESAVIERGLFKSGSPFIQKPYQLRELLERIRLELERGSGPPG